MRWLVTHGPLAWLIAAWDKADTKLASTLAEPWWSDEEETS